MANIEPAVNGVRATFEEHELQLLHELVGEMRKLLEADIPDTDAVIQRLFPRAHEEQDEERAYRDLIGEQLTETKRVALRTVEASLTRAGASDAALSQDETEAWLTLLTDLRLAIGTRLGVDEGDMDAEIDADDPGAAALSVLHWLGWVQESMLEAMERRRTGGK